MPTAPALADWQASVNGVLIGPGTAYEVVSFEGWEESPTSQASAAQRPTSHGTFPGNEWTGARSLPLQVEIAAATSLTFAEVLATLRDALVPAGEDDAFEVWYKLPTRPALLSWCKTLRRRARVDVRYERGLTVVEAELRADDPLLYGSAVEVSTGFPDLSGGLEFDLFTDGAGSALDYLEFGEASATGRVTVANAGSEAMFPLFTVTGPVPAEGFTIIEVGGDGYLQFEAAVASGAILTLDGDTGECLLDGVSDRSKFLTVRRWPSIPPGSSSTFYFASLGAATAASLTVTYAPAWM